MRIMIFIDSELAYNHIKSRLQGAEVAPYAPDLKAIRETLGSFEAEIAILDMTQPWANKVESTLTRLNIFIVPYTGDFETVISQIDLIRPNFTMDDGEMEPEVTNKNSSIFLPTVDLEEFELPSPSSGSSKESYDPDLDYFSPIEKREEEVENHHHEEQGDGNEDEGDVEEQTESEPKPEKDQSKKKYQLPKINMPSLPNIPNWLKGRLREREGIIEEDELFDTPMIEPKARVKDRVIGYITIGVIGAGKGVGTTHTSILLANYLAGRNESVAIVEAGESYAFSRIERTYEGVEDGTILRTASFEIDGVVFYKFTDNLNMLDLLGEGFKYIVIDFGAFDDTEWFEEFQRCQIQIVVGSGAVWKQPDMLRFFRLNKFAHPENWNICIPMCEEITLKDMKKDLPVAPKSIFTLPYHPEPFEKADKHADSFDQLFEFNSKKKRWLFF